MLAGNLVSILTGGAIHAIMSFMQPQNYDWVSSKNLTMVDADSSDVPEEEYSEVKLKHARSWIVKWGVAFTILIVVIWPIFALPAKVFSQGYFTLWAAIAIVWGTVGSAVIIILPVYESWEVIQDVLMGMFTGDILEKKVDDLTTRLKFIMKTMPEAERSYYEEIKWHKHGEAKETFLEEEKEAENGK